ncbi:MAG: FtsX-like permease family protein [Rhodanobacteraceae bacterium]
MTLHPILSALRKHKAGVVLIALQIALTLAIVCNAIFIIGHRIERINRPTGIDENNLFMVSQIWVGAPTGDDAASIEKLDALQRTDVQALRQLPDVQSAIAINSLPLINSSWTTGIGLKPAQQNETTHAALYFGDERMIKTLGLRLIAGRDFNAGDVHHMGARGQDVPPIVIVTKDLAGKLFPHGDALGKAFYIDRDKPSTIIGIVARMQVPSVDTWANEWVWNSVLIPTRLDGNYSRYAIRAKSGRLDAAMRDARTALFAANPMRVIYGDSDGVNGIRSFAELRAHAYRADRGMAILMGVVCLILLCVTAAGIVGLTSFWVGQRRKQIGVRRALGARKLDILHYFQIENLMIAGAGVVIGIVLAIGLNLLLMGYFEMTRIPLWYVLTGVLAMLVLGQGAVFVPARRASNVPPVEATRSV